MRTGTCGRARRIAEPGGGDSNAQRQHKQRSVGKLRTFSGVSIPQTGAVTMRGLQRSEGSDHE